MKEDELSIAPNVVASVEIVKTQMRIDLNKQGFLAIQGKVSTLEVTEDNLTEVSEFLSIIRSLKKSIDVKHKELKEPYLKACQNIDEAKRQMNQSIDNLAKSVEDKYNKICNEIEQKRRAADAERKRIQSILDGIEANCMAFARSISECNTSKKLIEVERLINLEKANKNKYKEFSDKAVERLNSLSEMIKNQKKLVLQLEELEAKNKTTTDDAERLEIEAKKHQVVKSIDEGGQNAQLKVSQDINNDLLNNIVAEEVLPDVKARRTTWEFDVTDIDKVRKLRPNWLTILVNRDAVKEYMKYKVKDGEFVDGKEYEVDGIRFFQKRSF